MSLFAYTRRSFARELLLIGLAIAFFVPAYVMATLSLKSTQETFLEPLAFPTSPDVGNYPDVWRSAPPDGMWGAMTTSVVITVASVFCIIVLGSLCAYALARRPSRLSTTLYVLFVLGIILPLQLAIIPLYVVMRELHLVGTVQGMVILYTGLMMPFSVFLYTGFIRALPKDYEEAAQVDGAGLIRTWFHVVFPLLAPVTGTVAMLAGLIIWNDFFVPLIFLYGSGSATLPIAVYSFVGENATEWNLIMAGVAISILPVILFFLFAQRQLIRGFSGGTR